MCVNLSIGTKLFIISSDFLAYTVLFYLLRDSVEKRRYGLMHRNWNHQSDSFPIRLLVPIQSTRDIAIEPN